MSRAIPFHGSRRQERLSNFLLDVRASQPDIQARIRQRKRKIYVYVITDTEDLHIAIRSIRRLTPEERLAALEDCFEQMDKEGLIEHEE